ncbi:MAG: FkbM family methyltransferase [Planctomycetes bacterium]|nr:FkbM family methyltransferase [Planctomycetota bacterium]
MPSRSTPLRNRLPWTRIKLAAAKVAYRVMRPLLGKKPRIITRGGIRYRVDLSEAIDFALYLTGSFQSHVAKSGLKALPQNSVVLDVGANVGSMTLAFAKRFPKGRVFAFEPTHPGMARLAENLALNPELAARVTPVQAFVSDRSAKRHGLTACSSWKLDGSAGAVHPLHGGSEGAADGVPAVSIDDWCREQGVKRVDLVKIDTDGHELAVLRGARATLKKFRPALIFEIGLYLLEERGVRVEEYFDFLEPLGYACVSCKSGREVTRETAAREIPTRSTTDLLAIPIPSAPGRRAAGGKQKR